MLILYVPRTLATSSQIIMSIASILILYRDLYLVYFLLLSFFFFYFCPLHTLSVVNNILELSLLLGVVSRTYLYVY